MGLIVALAILVAGWSPPAEHASSECFGSCAKQVLSAFRLEYVPKRQKTISWGDTLLFVNTDPDALAGGGHTVTHFNPYGPPQFDSGVVPVGGHAPVAGVERLLPGKYLIYCKIHPFMRGKIQVFGGGFDLVPIAP